MIVRTERLLWLLGLMAIAVAGAALVEALFYQEGQGWLFDRARAVRAQRSSGSADTELGFPRGTDPALLGRLEIPRLGFSAMVREGTDPDTLKVAVGHVPGTARPGQSGNVALAGHRDSFFRRLKQIRRGDVVKLTTLDATSVYRVNSIQIVGPGRADLLASDGVGSKLTLITCYPFEWVGPAPERLVVRASLSPP